MDKQLKGMKAANKTWAEISGVMKLSVDTLKARFKELKADDPSLGVQAKPKKGDKQPKEEAPKHKKATPIARHLTNEELDNEWWAQDDRSSASGIDTNLQPNGWPIGMVPSSKTTGQPARVPGEPTTIYHEDGTPFSLEQVRPVIIYEIPSFVSYSF